MMEPRITTLPNGWVLTVEYDTDDSEKSRKLERKDGSAVEPAGGYFYDRLTLMMYDPNGKETGWTYEANSRAFIGSNTDPNVTIPPLELLSPYEVATKESAEKVKAELEGWFPGWEFIVDSVPSHPTPGFVFSPSTARVITSVKPGGATKQVNAGLTASMIMRSGGDDEYVKSVFLQHWN